MRLRILKYLILGTLGFFTFLIFTSLSSPGKTKTINFYIDDSSTLSIEGSSSVNSFYCGFQDQFEQYCCTLKESENSTTITFENTVLNLETYGFNCGSKGINRDMWKALQAEKYPKIRVKLLNVQQPSSNSFKKMCEKWVTLKAQVMITIAGKSKSFNLDVEALELESNRYRFISFKELLMSDFGIDPPRPLLGLIKVHDKITINFDLIIQVEEA